MAVRSLVFLIVFFCGCAGEVGPDWVSPEFATGYVYTIAGASIDDEYIRPPAPPTWCTTCNGSGKVGDGTIEVDCMNCKEKEKPKPTGEIGTLKTTTKKRGLFRRIFKGR